uniref:Uncharacterized protein n=1 Tax=Arundo donax TaxID=35708 RepID=A0A0A9A0B2_ARUDO
MEMFMRFLCSDRSTPRTRL